MNRKLVVVFDLDGTLVESAPDILDSLNHCLSAGGLEPVSPADLHRLAGQGSRIMIERALTGQNITPEPQHVERLAGVFLQHCESNIPKTCYFNGITIALDALQQAEYLRLRSAPTNINIWQNPCSMLWTDQIVMSQFVAVIHLPDTNQTHDIF